MGHYVLRGDVILPRTGLDESPAVLEDNVVGMISLEGPWDQRGCGDSTGNVLGHCSRDIGGGAGVHGRPSIGVGIVS